MPGRARRERGRAPWRSWRKSWAGKSEETDPGPIAQVTFADQLAASPDSERTANGLPTPLGSLVLPDCANLSTFAYGLIEVDSATKRLTVTLKNDAGQAFCSATLLPSGLRPRQD